MSRPPSRSRQTTGVVGQYFIPAETTAVAAIPEGPLSTAEAPHGPHERMSRQAEAPGVRGPLAVGDRSQPTSEPRGPPKHRGSEIVSAPCRWRGPAHAGGAGCPPLPNRSARTGPAAAARAACVVPCQAPRRRTLPPRYRRDRYGTGGTLRNMGHLGRHRQDLRPQALTSVSPTGSATHENPLIGSVISRSAVRVRSSAPPSRQSRGARERTGPPAARLLDAGVPARPAGKRTAPRRCGTGRLRTLGARAGQSTLTKVETKVSPSTWPATRACLALPQRPAAWASIPTPPMSSGRPSTCTAALHPLTPGMP